MADFAGIDDTSLGLYGAFGYDLLFQFEPIDQRLPRAAGESDLHLFLPDQFFMVDRRKETAFRYDYEIAHGELTTAGLARDAAPITLGGPSADTPPNIETDHSDTAYAGMVDQGARGNPGRQRV